jgi:hypothetical protein
MKAPVFDRSKPFAEIHDASGRSALEQDGQLYNASGEPLGPDFQLLHTPQPEPPPPPEPEPEPPGDEEDESGTRNHEEHSARHGWRKGRR